MSHIFGRQLHQTEKFAKVFKKPFNNMDYKQLYILEINSTEINSNIFYGVALAYWFSDFTRFLFHK